MQAYKTNAMRQGRDKALNRAAFDSGLGKFALRYVSPSRSSWDAGLRVRLAALRGQKQVPAIGKCECNL
jgi:hypothetical protein